MAQKEWNDGQRSGGDGVHLICCPGFVRISGAGKVQLHLEKPRILVRCWCSNWHEISSDASSLHQVLVSPGLVSFPGPHKAGLFEAVCSL